MISNEHVVYMDENSICPSTSRISGVAPRRVPLQALAQPPAATSDGRGKPINPTLQSKRGKPHVSLGVLDLDNIHGYATIPAPLPSPESIYAFDFGLPTTPGSSDHPSEPSECHHSTKEAIAEIEPSDLPALGSRRHSTKSTYSLFPSIKSPPSTRANTPHRDSFDSLPLCRPSAVRLRSSTVGTSVSSDVTSPSSSSGTVAHCRVSTSSTLQSRWSCDTITQPLLDYDVRGSYFTPFLCSGSILPQTPYPADTPDRGAFSASRRRRASRGCGGVIDKTFRSCMGYRTG